MKSFFSFAIYLSPLFLLPLILLSPRLGYEYAELAGNLSLILFVLTLLPGIIKRLSLQNSLTGISQTILPIRRELGILMFILAFIHYLGVKLIPTIQYQLPLILPPYQVFGFIALILTLPLFLTSNTWSSRILKRNWKRLHRVTYLIGWMIFGHVVLQGISWQSILIGLVMILEMISLSYAWITRHRA